MRTKFSRAVSPILGVVVMGAMLCARLPAATPSLGPSSLDAPRVYVHPRDFDFETLLGDPPAQASPEHQAEIATLLGWQYRRTSEQVIRCRRAARGLNVWLFDDVLGDGFNQTSHPLTSSLFDEVDANVEPSVKAAKKHWTRARPSTEDPEIEPCVHRETSASYPSGHATHGMVDALVLAAIFPEQRDALLARGEQIGNDRVIAGIHWPSDVAAGQKLGREIAHRLLDDTNFQYEVQRAAEECHAGSAAAGNQPATRPATSQPVDATP